MPLAFCTNQKLLRETKTCNLRVHSKTVNYIARINIQSDPTATLNILHKITMKSSTLNSSSGPYLCIPKPPMLAVGGRLVVTPSYEALKLSIDYFFRVKHSNHVLVSTAFQEQADLDLSWFSNTSKILDKFRCSSHNPKAKVSTSTADLMREEFVSLWKLTKASSPKLNFSSINKTHKSLLEKNQNDVDRLPRNSFYKTELLSPN